MRRFGPLQPAPAANLLVLTLTVRGRGRQCKSSVGRFRSGSPVASASFPLSPVHSAAVRSRTGHFKALASTSACQQEAALRRRVVRRLSLPSRTADTAAFCFAPHSSARRNPAQLRHCRGRAPFLSRSAAVLLRIRFYISLASHAQVCPLSGRRTARAGTLESAGVLSSRNARVHRSL